MNSAKWKGASVPRHSVAPFSRAATTRIPTCEEMIVCREMKLCEERVLSRRGGHLDARLHTHVALHLLQIYTSKVHDSPSRLASTAATAARLSSTEIRTEGEVRDDGKTWEMVRFGPDCRLWYANGTLWLRYVKL